MRILLARPTRVVLTSIVGWTLAASIVIVVVAPQRAVGQVTCPTGQTYCTSGSYGGQCRSNTVTCPTGSVSTTVPGCTTCSCSSGQILCGNACQLPRSCTEPGKVTADQCTGACGGCQIGYTFDPATNRCVASAYLTIENVGDLTVRGMQQYGGATLDLGSGAGGQNLLYGSAKYSGMHAGDALVLLQTASDAIPATMTNRLRVDRDGALTAAGAVRGSSLCIGIDCRSTWPDVAGGGNVLLQATTPGTAQTGHLHVSGTGRVGNLIVAGGIQAGLGNIGIVDATGKIPTLSPTYVANLDGGALTNLNASNLGSGTVPDARLPGNLVRTTHDGGASNTGPWVTFQGGAAVGENVALRLADLGTADANGNILEFAQSNGTIPVGVARVRSVNSGVNAANGARLKLETATDNTGRWNRDQLVLHPNGNIGIGNATPAVRLDVVGNAVRVSEGSGTFLSATAVDANSTAYLALVARDAMSQREWRVINDQGILVIGEVGRSVNALWIDGNVGVGVGIAPSAQRLTVAGGLALGAGLPYANAVEFTGATRSFYGNSNGDLQLRIDADEATAPDASVFRVNNGANATVLQLQESGDATVLGNFSATELRARTGTISTDRPEYIELRALNSGPPLDGRAKLRVGGLVVGDSLRTVPASGALVQGTLTVEGTTALAGTLTVGGRTALIDRIRRERTCMSASSCFVPCDTGWLVLGGGCGVDTASLSTSAPNVGEQPEGWNCSTGQGGPTGNIVATVICGRPSVAVK